MPQTESTAANNKRIAKNTAYLYIRLGVSMVISLFTTRLVLNSLGASDFGIFNLVGGAIAMLAFLNACLAGSTQRFLSFAEGEGNILHIKQVFNVSIILHASMAVLVGIALTIFGIVFFNSMINIPSSRFTAAIIVYASLVISTIITIISVPYDAVINAHENMMYYAIVGVIESLLKLFVALCVVYTSLDKLIVYGILMALIPFIITLLMRIYCHRHYKECKIQTKKYWNGKLVKQMASFSGWSLLDAISGIVGANSLSIILNNFFGTLLNAAQGVANQVGGQLSSFSRSMIKAITPVITKSEGAGERNSMLYYSIIGSKYAYLLLAVFAIPFFLEADFILTIWLKTVPDWAVLFCQLQLISILFTQLTVNLWSSISATGDVKHFYICKSIVNSMPMVLTWICFYFNMQPYWMYIVSIICNGVINSIIIIYFAMKKCSLKIFDFLKDAIYPVCITTAISLAMGVLGDFAFEESYSRLFITCFLSFFGFGLGYWITCKNGEKTAIKTMLNKILHK